MRNKVLRSLPKNIGISVATGFSYTAYDYWKFNLDYPSVPVPRNTELGQTLEYCRNEYGLPTHHRFATTNRKTLAASSASFLPGVSKIVVSEKEIKKLSHKTNLSEENITKAIVAHEAAHIKEKHKLLVVSGSVLAHKITYNLNFLLRYGSPVRHATALLMFAVSNLVLAKSAEYRADYVAAQHGEKTRQDLTKILNSISTSSHSIFSHHPSSNNRSKHINNIVEQASDNTCCKKP